MRTNNDLYHRMKSEMDYTPILDTAVRELGVPSHEKAAQALDAFLQWFSLIPTLEQGHALQMIRSVDRIWHAFILNTRLYRQFCDTFIGFFVDHDPLDVVDEVAPKQAYADYTLLRLERAFGSELNPELYRLSEPATCCYWDGPNRDRACSSPAHHLCAEAGTTAIR